MYLASGSAGSAGVCAWIAATLRWWPRLTRNESAGAPTLLWTQLTNFNDSAETPTLSRDGKRWHFCAAQAVSVLAANTGQVWIKSVPDGEPL